MSSRAPWVRWFTSDWMAATAHLGPLEEGVYSKLVQHYYLTRKSLPADLDRLCMIARATEPASRRAVEVVVQDFFQVFDDPEYGRCYRHSRAEEEIAYSDRKHTEALTKGLKTAWIRHGSEDARRQLEALGIDVPSRTSSSTSSSTTSTTTQQLPKNQNQNQNQKNNNKPVARKISEDFWPNERNLAWLESEGVHGDDVRRLVVNFRDYWISIGKRQANWNLAFRRNPVVKGEIAKLKKARSKVGKYANYEEEF